MNIKETIRAEIDKRYAEYRAKMKTDDFTYYEGMADALDLFEQFLDTLPDEQPVEGQDFRRESHNTLESRVLPKPPVPANDDYDPDLGF